jgi:phage-related protein
VLTTALNAVTSILSSPAAKALFDFGSGILAVFLAFGTIGKVVKFAGEVVAGSLITIGKYFSFFLNPAKNLTTAYLNLGKVIGPIAAAFGTTAGPFLAAVGIIAALVAVLVLAYNKSEIFRNAIASLVDVVKGALVEGFNQINDAIKSVAPGIDGIMGVFKTLGDFLGTFIVPIFKVILVSAIKQFSTVISAVIIVVGKLVTVFSSIAGVVKKAFDIAISVVRSAINTLIRLWNSTLGKLKITLPKIGPFGGGTIGFPTIPEFAEGGTVYPSGQGTLARVAEAGRPERIEPLDPDGLSKRDKAMIKLLSSGQGGGMTINVYPSPGMDESELASLVSRQIAFQLRRGGA